MLAFRPSEKIQERVRELLNRSKSDEITEEETEELDRLAKNLDAISRGEGSLV